MFFNVSGLLRSEVGGTRHYTLEPEEPVLAGTVELLRVPTGVLVRCHASVMLEDQCSRCLVPFCYPADIGFEEIYQQQVDLVSGHRVELEDPDEAFLIALDNTIDIREGVRQYSEMAAEMRPLCKPDCPGICPVCGSDLNIAPCQCDRTPADPRWAALFALQRSNNG
jgi:uncharacterized protein